MFGTARLSLLTGMLCLFSTSMAAGTFTVDDLGDAPDLTPGDGVCATAESLCTLRAAIVEANAIAGGHTINFSVAGTISPDTDLPTVLQRVTIDGTSAPDYAGTPVLVLDGGEALSIGFNFGATASASRLLGLKIIGFAASGVNITASDVEVQHNHIGPVGGGTPNFDGIVVGGTGNHIGTGESAGNVIAGNTNAGIVLIGGESDPATQITIADADHSIELTSSYDDTLSVPDDDLTVWENEPTGIYIVSMTGDASCAGDGTFETAEPVQDAPVVETIVIASTDFNETEPAPAEVRPVVTQRTPLPVARIRASAARAPRPAHPGPSLDARDDKVIVVARPVTAEAAAVPAPMKEPLPPAPAPAPAPPASLRSQLGLMLLAAGTAFAALLRIIR